MSTKQLPLEGANRPVMPVREYVRQKLTDLSLRQMKREARRGRRRAIGETEALERRRRRERRAVDDQQRLDFP